ncbi:hypothetical protein B0T20DRAFT_273108 [Sordaria brevicollis]|uniref:Uncharacterized protein n=1 Tax=Sordaria brevicollis TaxID=83679 RepID=A0AAE0PAM7_SORBR|nr:hypothetical protein B0T20DRAFT_273108 [Sordaria brevicollis]
MGNCFSKGSSTTKGSNFQGQGRTLGGSSAAAAPRPAAAPAATSTSGGVISYGTVNKPATSASAPVPPAKTTTARIDTGNAGRTLGGGGPTETPSEEDAKSKAAQAAMARFQKDQGSGGDISKKLRAQKGMTRDALLKEESERERARRAADQAAEARNYN